MNLKIELATTSDIKNISDLSNDPIVRQNSLNPNFISWQDHIDWFTKKIKDKNTFFYVIKNKDNDFIGQIRFEQITNSLDYVVSISIKSDYRGKGLVSLILKNAQDKFKKNKNARKIYAYIKKENFISVKTFLKAGYSIVNEENVNGFEVYKLEF